MVEARWWQRGVVYQIYPRSWMDADGDGVGDLPGMITRLDHLSWLGVDAVWLSPVYPSPMVDFGYDVAAYCAVDPLFGTLADIDRLVAEAHLRGIRVLMDWVPNHTSDRHPWFVASRSSRDDPKRDWYVWRDSAPDGGPPNNWLDYAGNSAWKWDERTEQYYYRVFTDSQPDLNWRNPHVQEAMFEMLRFWLRRGVDGFRIDVFSLLVEDDQLRDNPPNPNYRPGVDFPYAKEISVHNVDQPETRELARHIRKVVDEFGDDKVLMAELVLPLEKTVAYYGCDGDGIQVPFNAELLTADWNARGLAGFIDRYLAALPPGGWPNWTLGNHDVPRVASRLGRAQARVAAMLLLTLPGTQTLYYGDEIGQRDAGIPADRVVDPIAALVPGRGRDPERAPMQWAPGPGAGFTTGEPWLPLAADAGTVTVAGQRDDPASMLTLHRRLLALRRREPAFTSPDYEPVQADGDVLAYVRSDGTRGWLVALNLGQQPGRLAPEGVRPAGRVEVSTHVDRAGDPVDGDLVLRGDEGVVVRLS
ncbi:MAG TPA: alpha-amylase family glycosyl hydrolase [Mycobacteriales bacterium]|nr:alpha-amylase family glycosyl hydrolase [Mycobacteriales bacterium]